MYQGKSLIYLTLLVTKE